jgi:hypothetical protein
LEIRAHKLHVLLRIVYKHGACPKKQAGQGSITRMISITWTLAATIAATQSLDERLKGGQETVPGVIIPDSLGISKSFKEWI